MSQILLFHGAVIGAVVGNVVLYMAGLNGTLAYWPLIVGFGIAGLFAWAYSPLPDSTGGTIARASGHGYWGLTPPEDDEVSEA